MADSYKIDQLQDLSGVKRYLRRKFSAEELDALADEAFVKIDESVVISSYGQGGGVTGQMSVPANLLLAAIEAIIAEGPGGRQLGTSPDFGVVRWSV